MIVRRAYRTVRRLPQSTGVRWIAAAIASVLSSNALAQPAEIRPDVAYGPLPSETGDLYIPAGTARRRPAVVVIHGGGWVNGSRHDVAGVAPIITSMGAVVFNIDYRLANKDLPATRWPAQLVDAQLAVRFLRAHATDFGIDPDQVGAVGDSAGGQLAVFLGVLPHIVPGDQAGLYPHQRPNVKAVVDQYGVMDLPGMGQYGTGSIEAMFGSTAASGNELLTASPIPSITAHSAPVYIIHGMSDEVVPFQQSRQLLDTLRAHGVAGELVPFNGGHAYGGLSGDEVGKLQVAAIKWLMGRL